MYIVGLINETNVLRTYVYTDRETALNELKQYRKNFQNNNAVSGRTTIVERDEIDNIVTVKHIMYVGIERYIMFLSKSTN